MVLEDNLEFIRELKGEGMNAMLSDGVNDALTLATKDVGIVMGVEGSIVAMKSIDVALLIITL